MTSGKKQILAIVIVLIILLFLVLVIALKKPAERVVQEEPQVMAKPVNPNALPTVEGGTREIIKEIIKTPEEGEVKPTSSPIAVPERVIQVEGASEKAAFRTFTIKAEGGVYTPSTLVVNDRDVVIIVFTAMDQPYNIFFPDFGVFKSVAQGETARLEFGVTPFGEYKFICKDCPQEMVGKLIVNKK